MSFQDLHKQSGDRSSSAPPSQAVAAGLFQINTAVATFRRLVDAIGTSKDTPDHRLKLQNTRQRILELVKETSAKLKFLNEPDHEADIDPTRKVQNAKVARDFQTTLQDFQKLQQLAMERESTFSPAVPPPPSSITISSSSQHTEGTEPSSEMGNDSFLMERNRQELLLLDSDVAFNEAVIEEREQGIQEIQGQIVEVNGIFRDLAVLLDDQIVDIDDIHYKIEASGAATTQAKVQLSKGSKSRKSNSWCWLVLALIVIVLAILVIFIIL